MTSGAGLALVVAAFTSGAWRSVAAREEGFARPPSPARCPSLRSGSVPNIHSYPMPCSERGGSRMPIMSPANRSRGRKADLAAPCGSFVLALKFHPDAGMILICDYGLTAPAPEMVKVRPVVVVSPRRRVGSIVTVVPLSSVAPVPPQPWHHLVPAGVYPSARGPMWAKCDMVAAVSASRLDRVKVVTAGVRDYRVFTMPAADLEAILQGVLAALGRR
jgi:mRNA interferase MazF